jgi:hypothetical protein
MGGVLVGELRDVLAATVVVFVVVEGSVACVFVAKVEVVA